MTSPSSDHDEGVVLFRVISGDPSGRMSMYMTVWREDDELGKKPPPDGEMGELRALSDDTDDAPGYIGFRKGDRRSRSCVPPQDSRSC
jgi:hypothetical protein